MAFRIPYLATINTAVTVICRFQALFDPYATRYLNAGELAAWALLKTSCEGWRAIQPVPGNDNDPGTIT